MTETVQLHTRDKRTVEAEAEIDRKPEGVRVAKAAAILAAGLVAGVASIVVPVLHLVSTWALPLLGAAGAWFVYNQRIVIGRVRGTCPLCDAALDAEGGPLEDPMWIRCQACQGPLRLELRPRA